MKKKKKKCENNLHHPTKTASKNLIRLLLLVKLIFVKKKNTVFHCTQKDYFFKHFIERQLIKEVKKTWTKARMPWYVQDNQKLDTCDDKFHWQLLMWLP